MDSAVGYGSRATGGADPVVVTSYADEGPGTLRDALSAPGRLITFSGHGTIHLQDPLRVPSSTTIDGAGLVELSTDGHAILPREDVSNLVIRGLRLSAPLALGVPTTPTETQQYGNRITLTGPIRDVWIDGCSFSRVGGKGITMWDGTTGVTVSRCKFHDSFYAILAGCTHGMPQSKWPRMEVTVTRCLFSGVKRRSPKCASGVHMHTFNCVVEEWGGALQDYGSGCGDKGQHFLEKNIYDPGPGTANRKTAYDCGKITDDGGFGYIRAAGCLMLRGCTGDLHEPQRVFRPPYHYAAAAATEKLRREVSA